MMLGLSGMISRAYSFVMLRKLISFLPVSVFFVFVASALTDAASHGGMQEHFRYAAVCKTGIPDSRSFARDLSRFWQGRLVYLWQTWRWTFSVTRE